MFLEIYLKYSNLLSTSAPISIHLLLTGIRPPRDPTLVLIPVLGRICGWSALIIRNSSCLSAISACLEFCAVSFSVLDPKSIGNKRGMKDQEVKNILSCINDILVLYSKGGSLDKICTVKLSNEKKGA